jgi:hypothetical protein
MKNTVIFHNTPPPPLFKKSGGVAEFANVFVVDHRYPGSNLGKDRKYVLFCLRRI